MSLKHITYGVGGGLVGVVALVGMQLVTTVKAADQAREAAIIAWAESNPSEAETVKRYRQECLCSPTDALLRPATVRPFTFAECAEKSVAASWRLQLMLRLSLLRFQLHSAGSEFKENIMGL
ncbi:hypothetical protein ACFQDN_21875 [Pseudomonas asuensis]